MGHKVGDKVTHPIPQSVASSGVGLQVLPVLRDRMGRPSDFLSDTKDAKKRAARKLPLPHVVVSWSSSKGEN